MKASGLIALSDDSGLCVEALDGEPVGRGALGPACRALFDAMRGRIASGLHAAT